MVFLLWGFSGFSLMLNLNSAPFSKIAGRSEANSWIEALSYQNKPYWGIVLQDLDPITNEVCCLLISGQTENYFMYIS